MEAEIFTGISTQTHSFFLSLGEENKKQQQPLSFDVQRNRETPVFLDRREHTNNAAFPYSTVVTYKAAK